MQRCAFKQFKKKFSYCAQTFTAPNIRLLELIERLDALQPWRHEQMPSCAHWLNAHCGLDLVTAREKVRIAHALPKLPLIREEFRNGELSYSKVRAITRVADWHNEADLSPSLKQTPRRTLCESCARCVRRSGSKNLTPHSPHIVTEASLVTPTKTAR